MEGLLSRDWRRQLLDEYREYDPRPFTDPTRDESLADLSSLPRQRRWEELELISLEHQWSRAVGGRSRREGCEDRERRKDGCGFHCRRLHHGIHRTTAAGQFANARSPSAPVPARRHVPRPLACWLASPREPAPGTRRRKVAGILPDQLGASAARARPLAGRGHPRTDVEEGPLRTAGIGPPSATRKRPFAAVCWRRRGESKHSRLADAVHAEHAENGTVSPVRYFAMIPPYFATKRRQAAVAASWAESIRADPSAWTSRWSSTTMRPSTSTVSTFIACAW